MAQNLKINILAQDKTKQAFNGIRGRLAGLRNAIFSVRGALAGIGAGLVIKSFVSTGRSIEDLNVRLKQLFGSTQEGAKAFDVMAKFAARVPFSLEQIQQASGNLAVVAGDANRLSKILEITGNVAAVTGLDFATTAEQIQRSFAGGIAAADIFRERGVRDLLGFSAGATVSAEETIKAFEKVFGKGGQFGTATDELATTFTGTLSMLGDKLFNFKRNVAGANFFDELKSEFKSLNEFIEENTEAFETISNAIGQTLTLAVKGFAAAIRGIAKAVNLTKKAVQEVIDLLNKIPFVNIKTKETQDKVNDSLFAHQKILHENLEIVNQTNNSLAKRKDIFADTTKIIEKDLKTLKDPAVQIGKILNMGIKGFSRGIAESIVLGKELNATFKDLGKTLVTEILATLIEIIARETVLIAIQKTKNILKQQEASFSFLNFGASLLGFGKASGGAVRKGQPTLVGERGAEMFIPNSSGQITQAARGTGGGAVNVNFNINTIDSRGFDQALVENRGTITSIINNALAEKGRGEII
tara:strand:- start:5208 stop:6791 length:1584 start_codon:yes stop_codon:yes gene_type:complete